MFKELEKLFRSWKETSIIKDTSDNTDGLIVKVMVTPTKLPNYPLNKNNRSTTSRNNRLSDYEL